MQRTFAFGLWLLAWLLAAACSSTEVPPPAVGGSPTVATAPLTTATPVELATATIRLANGQGQEFVLAVEVPQTREAMARGLMGRTSLPEDQGMLFLLGETHSGFWMKDTLIPLSVAFISQDGVIQDIQDMEPQTLEVHNTNKPYIYGLEVNQGWFARRGIVPGDRVRFPWPYEAPPRSPWE